jgi:putative hydrolase
MHSGVTMTDLALDEDHHVHSTFSDGADTLEVNIATAERLGLRRMGCVDHVRRDTTYLGEYVRAVRAMAGRTPVVLSVGIEAKILNLIGELDLPENTAGVDRIYIADHQFPTASGPASPATIKAGLAAGSLNPRGCVDDLVSATIAAMRRPAAGHDRVLAHLFSILPKIGLSESDVPDELIEAIGRAARETATVIEVSERWRCPTAAAVNVFARLGVELVASTDSHRASDIGCYTYVREIADAAHAVA